MGVYGAGLSTAVSQIISFLILLVLYLTKAQSTISFRAISRRVKDYANIVKVGFPSLIRQGLTSISNGLLNNLTKPYGDAAIAAMSVVNRFSSLVMCVGLGIGQGFQPVASFNHRAKEYKRVKQGLIFTTVLGFCVVAVLSFGGFLFADRIVYVFQKSDEVVRIGSAALRYATVGLLFLPLSVPVNMLYQSIRRAGTASFLSILRSGATLIPTLLITVHFFGLTGIQISQPIADAITGIICIPFIVHFLRSKE
jgi:Na+-driven multidrug efflux pump